MEILAKVNANGIEFYYEILGEGEPLVLLEGLSYASWMWYRQVDELAKHFKVIIFDNRGVGKTDKPDMKYSIELFADDAAEVLNALGIKRAHILGVSMGGYVAQKFTIKYPQMVDKLILCSTSYGGVKSYPIPDQTFYLMMKGGGKYNSIDRMKLAISTALNLSTIHDNEDVLIKIAEEKMKDPQPKYAYRSQLIAGASFDAADRVNQIKSETLIIAGKGDRVLPYENAFLLNEQIQNSRVEILEGSGHLLFMERPDVTNKLIVDFLHS